MLLFLEHVLSAVLPHARANWGYVAIFSNANVWIFKLASASARVAGSSIFAASTCSAQKGQEESGQSVSSSFPLTPDGLHILTGCDFTSCSFRKGM